MDNLTHTAVGLFLSRAGLDRYCAQSAWVLAISANIPDLDLVTLLGGQLNYLHYHRHLTHSLAALPVMALLSVLLVRPFARKPFRWIPAFGLAVTGVASHLLLDFTNIYGIRLLLPFSPRWFRLDLTSVVDLWIWAIAFVCLAGPLLGRLVNSEIGARGTGSRRGFAIAALVLLLAYDSGRALLHARAAATLESRIYNGATPQRVAALPHMINPFAWRGLVDTRDFYDVIDFNLREEFDPSRGTIFYKAEPSPAIAAANRDPVFREFFAFSQFPLERTTPLPDPPGAVQIEAMDMRFGSPAQPSFVSTALVNDRNQVLRAWFTYGAAKPR